MAGELCAGCHHGPLDSSLVMICEHRLCLPCAAQRLCWPASGSNAQPYCECPKCGVSTEVDVAAAHHLRALRSGGATAQQPSVQQIVHERIGTPARAELSSSQPRLSPLGGASDRGGPEPPSLSWPVLPTPAVVAAPTMGALARDALARDSLRLSSQPACGQCQESLAELNCRECGENLCAPCSANLHRRGRLREHTLVPLRGGAVTDPPGGTDRCKLPLFGNRDRDDRCREVMCPLHPEDCLQFFCLDCECECICAECAVHGEHRGHDVLNVRHAYKNMASRITDALSKAQARTQDQQKVLQVANAQQREVEMVIQQGREAIQDAFDRMRTVLGQKEVQLLRDAEEIERRACEQLQGRTLTAEGHVCTLQESQSALSSLDTRGDEVRVLNSYAKIRSKVMNILGPMDGIDHGIDTKVEDLKSKVQNSLDMQVASVASLSGRIADIRRADTSNH